MKYQAKRVLRRITRAICMNMVKIANGSASANSYQPKEPDELKKTLKNKKWEFIRIMLNHKEKI